MVLLDRLLSLGISETIPDRLARHVRVTNALALLGVVLSLTGIPIDAIGDGTWVVAIDVLATLAFAACGRLNAGGRHTAARVVLAITANVVILDGILETGAVAELRVVFLPLAVLPFLIFGVAERGWLITLTLAPVASYYGTAMTAHTPTPGLSTTIYMYYAPVLAFTMIIAGAYVFAHVERDVEDKLRGARARAAEAARLASLGEMSSGIAHEIRNPLAAIHLAATQIAEHPEEPVLVAQLGERIQRIVMRASRIIDALRSLSRDASGDPFVSTPVARILGDTLELCAKRFADHGVALTVGQMPPELVVEGRAVQLSQALVNLVTNAYDAVAASSERWVRIDVVSDGDRLELAVTDSGPGIPAGMRGRIFEPFFTIKAPDRGTGLGLSLSRELVAAHHARARRHVPSHAVRHPDPVGAAVGAFRRGGRVPWAQ
ncbi:MAG: ATP-binding protein [Proteobacteria bacterium]|nr:ATP-binding protein [Pseudomonadota bacterium]